MILRCTAKLLRLLDKRPTTSAKVPPPANSDWYANLVWLGRRKCLLLTHAGTLFAAFAADLHKSDLIPIGPFVVGLVSEALGAEGLPPHTFGGLDPHYVHVHTTADRSVLGCMNDMVTHCRYELVEAGGLDALDVEGLNRSLRRTIHAPRGYRRPIDLVRQWTAFDPKHPRSDEVGHVST